MKTETLILQNLLQNKKYLERVIIHLKPEYFHESDDLILFNIISDYYLEYTTSPTKDVLLIELENKDNILETQYDDVIVKLDEISSTLEISDIDWLLDTTEKFAQDKAMYNAIAESVDIMEDTTGKRSSGEMMELVQNALAVNFDSNIGHDYINDSDDRFYFYHEKHQRIEFDIDILNKITNGGTPKKTLSVYLAGPNVGKSLVMTHHAASAMSAGYNVLYITLEMEDKRIAERIDANLMNVELNDIAKMPEDKYKRHIKRINKNTVGKLIIKEYPTSTVHTGHFDVLLKELKIKKGFEPDVIYVDYLNLVNSQRAPANSNSYTTVKMCAEELRGLAVRYNCSVVTATQVNRGGHDSSDLGMTDVSESFGVNGIADFILGIVSTEELEEMGQYLMIQIKSRFGNKSDNSKFVIGVEKAKMRIYDVDQIAQESISKEIPKHDYSTPERRFNKNTKADKFAKFNY